jgi:hypothetical protein
MTRRTSPRLAAPVESDDGDRIRLTLPATATAARITRVGAAGLATRAGFTYREVEQLRLAVSEATALLAGGTAGPGQRGEGRLVVIYDVRRDGLYVDLHLEEGGGRAGAPVPELAALLLDASVDAWEVSDDDRHVALHKRRTDLDDDDGE